MANIDPKLRSLNAYPDLQRNMMRLSEIWKLYKSRKGTPENIINEIKDLYQKIIETFATIKYNPILRASLCEYMINEKKFYDNL
jgi:hypothetical protein